VSIDPPSAAVDRRIRRWTRLSWWAALIVVTGALLYLSSTGTKGYGDLRLGALSSFVIGAVSDRIVSDFYRRDRALALLTRQGFAAGLPWYAAASILLLATAVQVDQNTLGAQIVALSCGAERW